MRWFRRMNYFLSSAPPRNITYPTSSEQFYPSVSIEHVSLGWKTEMFKVKISSLYGKFHIKKQWLGLLWPSILICFFLGEIRFIYFFIFFRFYRRILKCRLRSFHSVLSIYQISIYETKTTVYLLSETKRKLLNETFVNIFWCLAKKLILSKFFFFFFFLLFGTESMIYFVLWFLWCSCPWR